MVILGNSFTSKFSIESVKLMESFLGISIENEVKLNKDTVIDKQNNFSCMLLLFRPIKIKEEQI